MWRLEKRVEDLVRYWGVVVHDTLETQTSFIVFGKRGDHDVVLKVIRQPGDEWRSGAVMAAFGAWGMARVYEHIEGALLIKSGPSTRRRCPRWSRRKGDGNPG
jgi:hypothetical protein